MRMMLTPALLVSIALAGCSKAEHERADAGAPASGDAAHGPTIAYGFTYRFALPGKAVGAAQDRHVAVCDRMGPARCQIQEMHGSSGTSGSSASTRFVVTAGEARGFGQELLRPVGALGGELTSRDFEAEDLSRQSVDAAAKSSEKSNTENRSALAAVRERLETSTVWVYYSATAGFGEQVGGALGAAGETLTDSIVALIYFLSAATPWAIVLGAIFFIGRTIMRRAARMMSRRGGANPPNRDPADARV